jgi:hypothetical protein
MYDNVGECKRQCKRLACSPRTGVEPGSVVSRGGWAARGDQEHVGCPLPRPTRQLRTVGSGNDMMLETREYPNVLRTGRSAGRCRHVPGDGTRPDHRRRDLPAGDSVRLTSQNSNSDQEGNTRARGTPHPARQPGESGTRGPRSTVKHRPADVVPQPLVVQYKLANRLRDLVMLPLALESSRSLTLAFRRRSTCGLDRIGGRTELVRGDVCDGPGLASSVRGVPCGPAQVSGRAHCMAARHASLGHLDLATRPGACTLDRLTGSWVLRLSRLEEVKDMFRARCRPKSEEMVIRISQSPTAADRHEARVPDLRQDHGWTPSACIRTTS